MRTAALNFMLVLAAIVCCSAAARASDAKRPEIEFKGIVVNAIDFGEKTADTTVSVEVKNPGPAFKVKDVRYRLKLNGEQIAEGHHKEEIKVPAGSSTTLDLPLKVNLRNIPGLTWSTVAGGFVVRYDLETSFTVPVLAIFNRKITTSFSGDFVFGQMLSTLPAKIRDRLLGSQ